jgi:hypothetical protein
MKRIISAELSLVISKTWLALTIQVSLRRRRLDSMSAKDSKVRFSHHLNCCMDTYKHYMFSYSMSRFFLLYIPHFLF